MSEELKDEELKGSFRGNLTNNKEPSNTPRIINGVIQDIGRIGDLNEKPKFIVTGNSMVPTIIPIFKEYGMAGEYFSFAGIQSLFVFRKEAEEKMILDRASGVKEVEFAKANLKYILESSIQNVVILINSDCLPYIMEFDIGITLLLQNNKKVYLVYDVVTHPTQAPNIYNFLLKQGKLTNQNLLKYSAKAKDFLSRFEKFDNLLLKHKNNPNLKIVSVRDLVCGKEYCPVGTTQGSYYADFNHFSFHGLKLIEARIKKEILNDIKNSN